MAGSKPDLMPDAGPDRDMRSGSGLPVPAMDAVPAASASRRAAAGPGPLPGLMVFDAAAMADFSGIAVRFAHQARAEGAERDFELVLAHAEAGRSIVVGRFGEEDIVATWRSFADASGLPMVIEHADGMLDMPYRQIGRLRVGDTRMRRRHGLLNGRRPRFLVRRKTGRLPLCPIVHRGREIVGQR